ncbi:uncharacterized protein LY79DRAFT_539022 [Colletotrichum navitas]|uniref:Secreted protein n=1 Tax=Colletotrichum navitas TaxID=681940 RepID=A0AAD8V9U8_9PEZI|nr:uncharacterized protein LY79DRAFT_539022 [Colletotrichum navitas]KAK1598384.1 hypothetical protein LY79DRAFT_539022 [Colletotrichum navitas]
MGRGGRVRVVLIVRLILLDPELCYSPVHGVGVCVCREEAGGCVYMFGTIERIDGKRSRYWLLGGWRCEVSVDVSRGRGGGYGVGQRWQSGL